MDNIAQSFETYFSTKNIFKEDEETFEGFSVNDKTFSDPDLKKIVKALQIFSDDKIFDESFYQGINYISKKSHKYQDTKKMTSASDKERVCLFCHQAAGEGDRKVELGEFHTTNNVSVHYYCLLFSSALVQKGDDHQGIQGFLEKDILVELKRGSKLKCCYCKNTGATIGCKNKKCKKKYHFPCGLDNYTRFDFANNFISFCAADRCYQTGDNIGEFVQCQICKEDMKANPQFAMWLSCCQLGKKEKGLEWFHIICMKKVGLSAGLQHFRCPLCSYESEDFKKELQQNGIYMPDRDASWELEPNAFLDLITRPDECNVKNCKMIEENENKSNEGENIKKKKTRPSYTEDDWELVICSVCGSECAHRCCVNLPSKCKCATFLCEEFQCSVCQDDIKNFSEIKPDKKKNNSHRKGKVRNKFKKFKTRSLLCNDSNCESEMPLSRTDCVPLTSCDNVHLENETTSDVATYSQEAFNGLIIRELQRSRFELPPVLLKMKDYAENLSFSLIRMNMDENDVLESINGITSNYNAAIITIVHIKKFIRCSFNFMQMQVMKQLIEFVFLIKAGISQSKVRCLEKSLITLLEKCKVSNLLERKNYLPEDENILIDLSVTEDGTSCKVPQPETSSSIEQSFKDPQSTECYNWPMQYTKLYETCATCYNQLIPGKDKTSVILSTGELQIICSNCSACQRIANIFPKWNFVNSSSRLNDNDNSDFNSEQSFSTDDSFSEISDSELNSHFNKEVESHFSFAQNDLDNYSNIDNSLHEISNNLLDASNSKFLKQNHCLNSDKLVKYKCKDSTIVEQIIESKENCLKPKVLLNSSNQSIDDKRLSLKAIACDIKKKVDSKEGCNASRYLDSKNKNSMVDIKHNVKKFNSSTSQPEKNKRKIDQVYISQNSSDCKVMKFDGDMEDLSRTSVISAASSNESGTCSKLHPVLPKKNECDSDIRSELKKVRINRDIITDAKKNQANPQKHACSSFHLETSKKINCEMCKYAGRDLTNFRIESKEWFQCFSCKNEPKFCSMNHYDQWHTVEHNWMLLPDTPKEKLPTRICKLCKDQKLTRFYCPACRPEQGGFCSLEHFNLAHNDVANPKVPKKCKKEDIPQEGENNKVRNNDNSVKNLNDTTIPIGLVSHEIGSDACTQNLLVVETQEQSLRNIRFNREIKATEITPTIAKSNILFGSEKV